ncbi:hypothetical protein [Neorhodopirellula pilleata]|uniref:3-keto-disaccharide hydrolase domain-containing protein n=1 Tax=Neorhodopirellula pilleata TaxID=2714738 RepID=A0A5C6A6A7_9BACT|nr:hypothetical protein [Neorhodopirellula pilleata]TWT94986.1 hypothetical protein Pla100_35650 [Neorhodopirellula pilleata]
MNRISTFCLLLIFGTFVARGQASESPATVLGTPERLIVSSPFDQDHPKTRKKPLLDWQAGIGVWWIADGALHGDEVAEDKHASSLTYHVDATHLVIRGEFRLGSATHIAFGCRDDIKPHHHLARTFISRDGIWITHMSGIAKTTKSIKIAELKTPLDPDAWYSIMIEIIGDQYRVQVGEHVVAAKHSRFADGKGIVALITKGQGAQLKNVALWHAQPNN